MTNKEKISFEDGKRKLPSGWRWVKLGDVSSVHPGQHILENDYNRKKLGIGYLTGPADFGEIYPSITKWTEKPKAWCEPGDVLVTVKGAGVGKSNLAPNQKVAIGRQLMAIRPKAELVNRDFLYRVVIAQFSKLQAEALGATVPGLGRDNIENLEIPLPPLDEQKRIAAILNEKMEGVEEARRNAIAQLEAAKDLPAAYLRSVFNSPEAQQWESKQLGEITLLVQNGIYKSAENYGQGHPFLRMYNIQNDSWNLKLEPLAQVLLDEQELEKYKLRVGDLLISRVNSFELVGKCALVTSEAEGYVFENMLIRIRISDSVDSMFVAQQINSRTIREQIEKVAKRAVGQASINSEDLRRIKIVLPPITEQKHIATNLAEKVVEVKKICQTLESQLEAINQLPASLLHQAFNGEL